MPYEYDVVVIGIGPAGMAVSAMAAEMGLRVCAVEKNLVGGECMNVGCIPSKALLRMGKARALCARMYANTADQAKPELPNPFTRIAKSIDYISKHKTLGMLNKVDLLLQQGPASFTGPHEIQVGSRQISARRIFICAGTRPAVPDIPGLRESNPLTNETLFHLAAVPQSLLLLGSGAIACEMAQAFTRLGCKVTMVFRGKGLLWREDREVTELLERQLTAEGVTLVHNAVITSVSRENDEVRLTLGDGQILAAEQILCALGRQFDPGPLHLEKAGIKSTPRGITVDKYLRTSQPHIYACGDVNGEYQFSHAAMHQGMLALMNSMLPGPLKRNFRSYPVPWTIFTEPQISRVGPAPDQLKAQQAHTVIQARYGDYGAAIAEDVDTGFVKAAVTPWGRVLSVTIVGEGSGEMINEWAVIIQNRLNLVRILMQQHSFPTMGFLSKRIAEIWAMQKMRTSFLQTVCRFLYRLRG